MVRLRDPRTGVVVKCSVQVAATLTKRGFISAGEPAATAEPADGPPPMRGKGSGLDAWVAYADRLGIDVDGLSRDEIVDAVNQHE